MADIKQKYKTPNGDNLIDKDFADFKGSGGEIGGNIRIPYVVADGLSAKDGSMVRISNSTDKMILQTIDSVNYFRPESSNELVLGHEAHKFKDVWVNGVDKSANGYTKLPNGMIMQWGNVTCAVPPNGIDTPIVVLPISFPNITVHSNGIASYNMSANNYGYIDFLTVSGNRETINTQLFFKVKDIMGLPQNFTFEIKWFAIGY